MPRVCCSQGLLPAADGEAESVSARVNWVLPCVAARQGARLSSPALNIIDHRNNKRVARGVSKVRENSEAVFFTLSISVNVEFWWVIAESYPGKRAGEITVARPKLFLQDPSSVPRGSIWQSEEKAHLSVLLGARTCCAQLV